MTINLNSINGLVLGLLALFSLHGGMCAAAMPNVILVITDDQGYGDIAAHGNTMIRTPHLDRLHGLEFRFFALPIPAQGAASMPVRAFAEVLGEEEGEAS